MALASARTIGFFMTHTAMPAFGQQPFGPVGSVIQWAECDFTEADLTFRDAPGPAGNVLGRLDPARLRCGFLTVPENHVNPGDATVRLAFGVIAAERPTDAPPLLYLIGGPGGGALNPFVLAMEGPALASGRDVVILDQRGTGRSQPHLCPDMDRAEAEQAAMDLTAREALVERRRAQRDCLARLEAAGIDPASYDIAASVADIEALREKLGYSLWDLYGESYGGVLAQHVIRENGESVRAVILAKPVPTDWSIFVRQVPNVAAGLARIYDDCARDGER
jgi:pimeloyl-ACP methyl ester carboxylesterase